MKGLCRLRGRLPAVLALAVAVSVLTPATSRAASTFTFYGSGWGHGLGLAQWGAYGLALKGWSHQKILSHFYKGTSVGPAPSSPRVLRVGLTQDRKTVRVTAAQGTVALRLGSTKGKLIGGRAIKQGKTWRVNVDKSGRYRVLDENGKLVGDCPNCKGHLWGSTKVHVFAVYSAPSKARIPEAGHTYNRGYIEFNLYRSSACPTLGFCERLIAVVTPQAYLYGLAEVPSGWPMEVLEVQAVAARTYAFEKVFRLGQRRSGCNCGVYDDVRDQVYAGWDKEGGPQGSRWVTAVRNTNGSVVLYKGAPIQAYYHSSSGGHTENNEYVWGGTPLPYLRGVCDPGDYGSGNPNRVWKASFSDTAVTQKLRPYTGNIGTVTKFAGAVRGVSGRIVTVIVVGTSGQKTISGTSLRRGLGLKDTRVWINTNRNIAGEIRAKYDKLMCAPGVPASGQRAIPGGLIQRFRLGAIYWNESRAAAYWVHGPVYDKYFRGLGESGGLLGMPRSDVVVPDAPGCTKSTCAMARFEQGNIYFKLGIGDGAPHELHGNVLGHYVATGETSGHLGFPITDVTKDQDGSTWAKFEHGGKVTCSPEGDCVEEGAPADLLVGISDRPDPLKAGSDLSYLVTVRNLGPGAASAVVLTNDLHGSVTLLSAKASQGSCSGSDPVVCSLGTLRRGESARVKLVVRTTGGGSIAEVGAAESPEPDPNGANDSATARTLVCTHLGTSGADTLRGTHGRDVMCGLGGNDTIHGFGGGDLLYGGDGNDVMYAGSGDDVVYGGSGADTVYGSWGSDVLYGGPGNDSLNGGQSTDRCLQGPGSGPRISCER